MDRYLSVEDEYGLAALEQMAARLYQKIGDRICKTKLRRANTSA
jgi:hypothetical protein